MEGNPLRAICRLPGFFWGGCFVVGLWFCGCFRRRHGAGGASGGAGFRGGGEGGKGESEEGGDDVVPCHPVWGRVLWWGIFPEKMPASGEETVSRQLYLERN